MKAVICTGFFAFLLTMTVTFRAEAAFTLQTSVSSDPTKIAASIQISTDSSASVAIGNYKVKYFFYEPNLPWTPGTAPLSPTGSTIATQRLDRTYTGDTWGRIATPMANHVIAISLPSTATVRSGFPYTVSFSLTAKTSRANNSPPQLWWTWVDWSARGTNDSVF